MIVRTLSFVAAVIATYVVAAVIATQFALASITSMGLPVGIGKRIAVTGHDLVGMAPTLLPLIAIGLLIAFLVTGLLCRWVPNARFGLYVLAGAIAVLGVHFSLYQVFDITLVAVARTTGGLVTQAAAGALGGYVFVRLSGRTTTAEA